MLLNKRDRDQKIAHSLENLVTLPLTFARRGKAGNVLETLRKTGQKVRGSIASIHLCDSKFACVPSGCALKKVSSGMKLRLRSMYLRHSQKWTLSQCVIRQTGTRDKPLQSIPFR